MNLHILNDEKFFDPFTERLETLNLLDNNRFVVKEKGRLKYIRREDLVYGRLHNKSLIGNPSHYDKVFIHSFSFDLYRWVNQHHFKELNWMIWGKELYESRMIKYNIFEPQTKEIINRINRVRPIVSVYYRKAEQLLLNIDLTKVHQKVDNILTWIVPEYEFAVQNIKGLRASHQHFAYLFELKTNEICKDYSPPTEFAKRTISNLKCMIGNSGAASNNHMDALIKIAPLNFKELTLPISYGDADYIDLLKQEINRRYKSDTISYLQHFFPLEDYVKILKAYDIFISNSLRPIGMGNIWIALLTGKLVFMNKKNLVFSYLQSLGLEVFDIDNIHNIGEIIWKVNYQRNQDIAKNFLADEHMNKLYTSLFGSFVAREHEKQHTA